VTTVYISDLDGTLVNERAELSAFSQQSLRDLLEDGLPFTVASARSVHSIQQMLGGLPIDLPVISFNGAFLSDIRTGHHEVVNAMDREVARDIFECLPRHGCVPYIATYDGAQERVYYDQVINAGMQWYLDERLEREDPRWQRAGRLSDAFADQVVGMTMINRREVLADLELDLAERFADSVELHHFENEYNPGWYWLTVHDRRATKDQAIRSLQQLRGLHQHKVVVFGDNRNDIRMFREADLAVAVANAIDEIKTHAHQVIGSNLEDAVVKYLQQNWKPV
jgi:Cof subfamily protein (haloacid dehalogenase superfamily)